jgi:hypothetical protein
VRDDAGVVHHVGGGGDGRGELGDVGGTADIVELAGFAQLC